MSNDFYSWNNSCHQHPRLRSAVHDCHDHMGTPAVGVPLSPTQPQKSRGCSSYWSLIMELAFEVAGTAIGLKNNMLLLPHSMIRLHAESGSSLTTTEMPKKKHHELIDRCKVQSAQSSYLASETNGCAFRSPSYLSFFAQVQNHNSIAFVCAYTVYCFK